MCRIVHRLLRTTPTLKQAFRRWLALPFYRKVRHFKPAVPDIAPQARLSVDGSQLEDVPGMTQARLPVERRRVEEAPGIMPEARLPVNGCRLEEAPGPQSSSPDFQQVQQVIASDFALMVAAVYYTYASNLLLITCSPTSNGAARTNSCWDV